MTKYQRQIMTELKRAAREERLEHHLEAAQSLASRSLDVETIEGMMRGMFSRTEIRAMLAQARQAQAKAPLPLVK